MRIVDQTGNFQGMFQVLCYFFIFIIKEEGVPKAIKKQYCSIIDAKLNFVPRYSVSDVSFKIGGCLYSLTLNFKVLYL